MLSIIWHAESSADVDHVGPDRGQATHRVEQEVHDNQGEWPQGFLGHHYVSEFEESPVKNIL